MTLTQLANFIRIAELKSLSKAAAVIRIAQPALSRQIRHLELELGSPLLIRHAWGVALTPGGEVLLEHARRLLSDAEGAREAVQALASEPTGRVSIAVPSSLAVSILPPLASMLETRYPRVKPHFIDGFSAAIHQRALAGEVDLAVLYEDRAIGPLETAPLLSERLMLIAAPDAVIADPLEALATHSLIAPSRPNRLRLILDEAVSQAGAHHSPITEVDSLPAIISMVELGAGCTILPFSAVAKEVARESLGAWPLRLAGLERILLLARPTGGRPTPAALAVEGEVRGLVSALAEPMQWRPLGPL